MKQDSVQRALEVVKQEMGARDARIELGGRASSSPDVLSVELPLGFRLVALFDGAPLKVSEAKVRLRQLAESFFETQLEAPKTRESGEQHLAQRRLDDELCSLAGRTGAWGASVIDQRSPVIWGSSEDRREDEDLETFIKIAKLSEIALEKGIDLAVVGGLVESERASVLDAFTGETYSSLEKLLSRLAGRPMRARKTHLLHARALAQVREWSQRHRVEESSFRQLKHEEGLSYFARSFAGIYVLVLYFPDNFSELHVEGTALHSLSLIERHVLGLPPIDPGPQGGKVLKLPMPS